jgi:predicted ATP-grasp superfamily ATP-dependent carboligase
MIFEPRNRVEVITPKGDGIIWLVTDYGHETDTIYTVILNESKELWQFCHKDLKIKGNFTFGRK